MSEGCFAVDMDRRCYQLHLRLDGTDLSGLVDALANDALAALAPGFGGEGASVAQLRKALETRLRQHVVAMDLCGLFSQCRLAEPFDPWK